MKPGLVNTVLDGYKLQAEIASGSCGTVFQAENLISGERVALKIFPGQGSLADRELQAIRLYQSIEHQNLIRIHHVGQKDDMLFYTMDWCESSLAERKVSAEELAEIAGKLTGALAELHKHGLLHRDIKPENILFRKGEAVLGDIGLVTRGENATYGGTPGFMPPDLATGRTVPNEYTDCYALAKSLYHALTGEKPSHFPSYSGPLCPAASLIMCAALAVCSEKPKIRTAAELLDFLNQPPPVSWDKKRKYLYLSLLSFLMLILIAGAATCFIVKKEKPKSEKKTSVPTPQKVQYRQPRSLPRQVLKEKPRKEEKESGEILALRAWNEQNKLLIPQCVSPVQRCEKEFEIKFNNRKIDLLQRSHRREISEHEFFQENRRLASLWKTVKQLLKSGIGAETLDQDYGELKEKLTIPDIGLHQQWVQADLDWQSHKLDCIKELLRRTRETGRDAAGLLQEMAEKDAALQFFGVDQAKYLGEYDKTRFSGRQDAKQRSDEAIEKYLQCRNVFLRSLNITDTSGKDSTRFQD